ncbi:MAG: glycosyltransferase family 2 protein [Acidimicrobiales bacterium]|jgi:chlorobactene glucosyltransferase|nr:glycosyltransferase family 2 protein [Acidimicrobiales bacterium]MDP6298090.1 glycosyltransferase family 2 protein [Acidimicrobiales bacterium]HJM29388.1 glycosyltransferase family 2 protein [Acidimicrobiales bacterium]HJM96820.1 glycosyltransferase family 2 protein [Acidimicrobiales bacterium]
MSWDFIFGRFLTLLLVTQLGLILWNLRVVTRPGKVKSHSSKKASLLIPARNEEGFIGDCVRSLLRQDHPNIEIIVLDDHSTDRTRTIVESVGESVKVLSSAPIPKGWTGKNWACHQLSQHATGDVLFFVDADAVLEPIAVSSVLKVMENEKVDLVASLLRNRGVSFASRILLPIVNHAVLALFPASLVHRSSNPDIALAFGPFIGVSQLAYRESGGHAAHPGHIVDDVQLARSVKAAGYHQRLINGTDLAATTWYSGVVDIWKGFSKNAYGALSYRTSLSLITALLIAPLLALPFLRLMAGFFGAAVPMEVLWQVVLLILGRFITSTIGRDPLWGVMFHPFAMIFWGATLFWSMTLALTGRQIQWKSRAYTTKPQARKNLREEN